VSIRTVNLTVEVHFQNSISSQDEIIYRIYINEELLVERSWNWDNKTFLKENICIAIDVNKLHQINFESFCLLSNRLVKISTLNLQNLQCANEKISIVNFEPQSITFRIV
jgi:hypothetical protein